MFVSDPSAVELIANGILFSGIACLLWLRWPDPLAMRPHWFGVAVLALQAWLSAMAVVSGLALILKWVTGG